MRRTFPLLALLVVFPSLVSGQNPQSVLQSDGRPSNSVIVTVTDESGGVPPGTVRVELLRGGIPWAEASSDPRGRVTFTGLPVDVFSVRISLAGFQTQEYPVWLSGDVPAHVTARLAPTADRSKPSLPPGSGAMVSVRELAVPRKARRQFAKAHRRYRENDLRAAIKHQLRGLEIDPTFAPAHNQLGFFYLRLGRLDKAKEPLETALQLDSSLLPAYLNMSTLLAQEGDVERAGEVLSQANQRHPQRGEPYYAVAKIQYDMGNLDQAEQACREALARDHSLTPEAHLLLVNIYQQRGETDKMPEHLEKYLAEAPEGQFAQQTRTVLKQFRRKRAKNPS